MPAQKPDAYMHKSKLLSSQSEQPSGAAQPPARASERVEPCNTTRSNCTVLRKGIDSLYLSFPGELSEEWEIRLDLAREAARSSAETDQPMAQISILDHLFEMAPSAGKHFKYLLRDGAFRIQIKSQKSKHLPLASCQISSEFLTAVGVEQAVSQLRLILSGIGVLEPIINVARLDQFVDFVTDCPIDSLSKEAWVTRAKFLNQHWVNGQSSGWSIGRGIMVARLYDKTLQIQESGQSYLLPMWKEQGWNGTDPVFRLEFQFRNGVLREFQSSRYPDVMSKLGGLWDYASRLWLRLTIPNPDDKTKSRWEAHPLWQSLQEVGWEGSQDISRIPVMLARPPSPEKLFRAYFSSLTSFMGARGITDPLEAAQRLYEESGEHFESLADFKGAGFYDQLLTRAAKKAMSYHLAFPGTTERAKQKQDKAVADAYRKKSGR